MSGWGVNLVGYGSALRAVRSLLFEFEDGAAYVCGPTVKYAIWHEIGTSKMEARPFAKPAAERVQANLDSQVGMFLDVPLAQASEDAVARAAALAVQMEMTRIVTQKGIIDTGALRSSISIEKVA